MRKASQKVALEIPLKIKYRTHKRSWFFSEAEQWGRCIQFCFL